MLLGSSAGLSCEVCVFSEDIFVSSLLLYFSRQCDHPLRVFYLHHYLQEFSVRCVVLALFLLVVPGSSLRPVAFYDKVGEISAKGPSGEPVWVPSHEPVLTFGVEVPHHDGAVFRRDF